MLRFCVDIAEALREVPPRVTFLVKMLLEGIPPLTGEKAHGRAGSVILVDDDADTTEMYRIGLEAAGYQVRVAHDGDSLFHALAVAIPDIIVLDWHLPGQKGDEVMHRMRLDPRTRSLPVFMLSNYPTPKDGAIDRAFLAGAVAWLEKVKTPPARLAETLGEALKAAVDR